MWQHIQVMVIAYIRVSTEEQSCSSQRFEISNWVEKEKLTVDQWVEESVSGTVLPEKRLLGNIIEKMEKGDILVCTELSRLGRSMLMIMGILNECSQKGINIYSIKDNFHLDNNINSKIIAFAFALAAEIERTLISQRTKEALADRKAAGVRLGRPPGSSKKKEMIMSHEKEIRLRMKNGESLSSLARAYNVNRNTLSRYLSQCSKPASTDA